MDLGFAYQQIQKEHMHDQIQPLLHFYKLETPDLTLFPRKAFDWSGLYLFHRHTSKRTQFRTLILDGAGVIVSTAR